MKSIKLVSNYTLFMVEIGIVVMLVLSQIWPNWIGNVVHASPLSATMFLSVGLGMIGASIILRMIAFGEEVPRLSKRAFVIGMGIGLVTAVVGGGLAVRTFPELVRESHVLSADERWQKMAAVSVRFDADGGTCVDGQRIVKLGNVYGQSMNVYPAEDERRMILSSAKIDLREGWIYADRNNETENNAFINYFTSNAIPHQVMGGKWTYVVDVAESEGEFLTWPIGQTLSTNYNVYAQLKISSVRRTITGGEKQFLVLDSTEWGEKCNMLDRAYIHLKRGQHFKAKFCVSLFAGIGVNANNYHYVAPGEVLACQLPKPTRSGYEFLGWYDGAALVTEQTPVVKRESHTLKAKWRKL